MMSDEEFTARIKELYDKCEIDDIEEKKSMALAAAYACDTDEHEQLIYEYLQKDGITLPDLFEYILSIIPPVEIVDDDEDE